MVGTKTACSNRDLALLCLALKTQRYIPLTEIQRVCLATFKGAWRFNLFKG